MKKYIIALDQGTTSSRAMLIDRAGRPVASVQRPVPADLPAARLGRARPAGHPLLAAGRLDRAHHVRERGHRRHRFHRHHQPARDHHRVGPRPPASPSCNAIVWQCRRTAPIVRGASRATRRPRPTITARTGLVPDAYFSASKLDWILDNVPGARERAEAGELCFGTVDSWLIWKLTDGARARHGRDQRQPHHALQHPREALGSLPA